MTVIDHQLAEAFVERFADAQEALATVRLKPWADSVMVLVPQNRPEDFAHFVHFLEAMAVAASHFATFARAQGTHEEEDVAEAVAKVHSIAHAARSIWNDYKARAGLVTTMEAR